MNDSLEKTYKSFRNLLNIYDYSARKIWSRDLAGGH